MNEKAIIADDGRLLCANPTCKNIELHYHIQHDRYDAYRIRYNAKTHEAYLVDGVAWAIGALPADIEVPGLAEATKTASSRRGKEKTWPKD
jgi:hypothetical protein